MRVRWLALAATLLTATLTFTSGLGMNAGLEAGEPTNIVLIVADDLRADVLSAYGGPVNTPNLDRLARAGCRFDQATCGYPICHVSRTEILTGRSMVKEAVSGRPIEFDPNWSLLPKTLRAEGWETIHVGKWHCRGDAWKLGYDRTESLYSGGSPKGSENTFSTDASGRPVTGYTRWSFKTDENRAILQRGIGLTPETDRLIADGAASVIERRQKPLFLHVNFTAPHDPLLWPAGSEHDLFERSLGLPGNFLPEHPFDHGNQDGRDESIVPAPRSGEDVLEQRAVYSAVVENLDLQLGRLFDALRRRKMLEDSLIIFTSDHGLALGSHGLMGKQNQYQHTAGVPLIISGPGVKPGQQSTVQCALRDLYPSICELLSLDVPSSVQGKSLVSVLGGEQEEIHPAVFGYFMDSQRMIRQPDGWKLIVYPRAKRTQLFHVREDPLERFDRANDPECESIRNDLQRQLAAWLEQQGAE